MLEFGVTVMLDPPALRSVELLKHAESRGFQHGWVFDSHVLSEDPYPLLALAAAQTSRIRLGMCVTNPTSRDPTVTASAHATLQEISGGRMALGLGRGDSAVRMIGLEPARLAGFEESIGIMRERAHGRPVTWRDAEIQMPWAERLDEMPVYVAAYGPKALAVAGRTADGIFIQLGDPELVHWLMGFARRAAEEAGRDPDALECIVCAPGVVGGDIERAREETRFFPAMVSNHVLDLLGRYERSELPPTLWEFVERRTSYDYRHHGRSGAEHGGFVDDETCDRFCLLGPAASHVERLQALEAAGATQVNLYLMTPEKEGLVDAYANDVIPALQAASP